MEQENSIQPFQPNFKADPKTVQALNILLSQEVPGSARKKRPGKGGKTFEYIDHIWLTKLLQKGMRNAWDFEVLSWQVYTDTLIIKEKETEVRSVVAQCKFTYYLPTDPETRVEGDPPFIARTVTEVGVFEPMPTMPTAAAVASAVSRGLCRCVMRALGVGIELYGGTDDEFTNAQAWDTLKQHAQNFGAIKWTKEFQDKLTQALKEEGVTYNQLAEQWETAFMVLTKLIFREVNNEDR